MGIESTGGNKSSKKEGKKANHLLAFLGFSTVAGAGIAGADAAIEASKTTGTPIPPGYSESAHPEQYAGTTMAQDSSDAPPAIVVPHPDQGNHETTV
jgi:hypothetical protein